MAWNWLLLDPSQFLGTIPFTINFQVSYKLSTLFISGIKAVNFESRIFLRFLRNYGSISPRKIEIEKFNGTNYFNLWRIKMREMLVR